VINGDLGYTTGPAVSPTVNGITGVSDDTYNQAGASQSTKLESLNALPCTFTFTPGAVDLATDTTHGTIGVYTPGVYCITGASSIGTAGISLSGNGTYVFRMTGALTTVASSSVLLNGSTACDIWWTPGGATTLGPDSTFAGNNIDDSGITIGAGVVWQGRALSFGGTISTDSDTLTVPSCSQTSTPTSTPTTPTSTPTTPTSTPTTPTSTPTESGYNTKICSSSYRFYNYNVYKMIIIVIGYYLLNH